MGKKIFLVTVGCVILFLCITIFVALTDIHSDLSWVKESFEWITIYGVPWVIVILLYLIWKTLDSK